MSQFHKFEIADDNYECNASLFIKDILDEIMPKLTEAQKAAIETAKKNNWHVKKGDMCRRYISSAGTDEEMDCVEIPAMAEICTKFKLWPE